MTKTSDQIRIIEETTGEADHGMQAIIAIVEHPELGRLAMHQAFGGIDTVDGGTVRWKHGRVCKILPDDTLKSLRNTWWNNYVTVWNRAFEGHDPDRTLIGSEHDGVSGDPSNITIDGDGISRLAAKAGLGGA